MTQQTDHITKTVWSVFGCVQIKSLYWVLFPFDSNISITFATLGGAMVSMFGYCVCSHRSCHQGRWYLTSKCVLRRIESRPSPPWGIVNLKPANTTALNNHPIIPSWPGLPLVTKRLALFWERDTPHLKCVFPRTELYGSMWGTNVI